MATHNGRMGDDELARLVESGDKEAFEELYDRHGAGVLALCRQLLGSREEAEDAMQHTFGVAFRELSQGRRPAHTRAWLYTVARNRCVSVLRGRRELPSEMDQVAWAGLPEEAERRADVRELVGDLGRLPEEQRTALVLSELADLEHAEVAEVLGCRRERVRALVYQARSTLSGWREARDRSCREVRSQIAVARGGELRRGHLRRHLQVCPDCAAYEQRLVKQRRGLALLLPVAPALALKERVLETAFASAAPAAGGAAGAGMATVLKVGAATLVIGAAGAGLTGLFAGGGDDERREPPPPQPAAAANTQIASTAGSGRTAQARKRAKRRAVVARRSRARDRERVNGATASASGAQSGATGQPAPPPPAAEPPAPAPARAPAPPPVPTPQAPAPTGGQAPAPPLVEAEVEVQLQVPPADELVP
jgi:RNA polymerase sigma factor (sigma-70 family)